MEFVELKGSRVSDFPRWAMLQQELLERMNEAAVQFVNQYTRADRTLVWRTEWPGMDGSDDPYEVFQNWPLLYALGGSEEVYRIAREMWEAITWQWTEYGQIHREFDAYYDWMHHGEGSLLFYFFGLADPSGLKDRQRAVRFAGFYTGQDPSAPNYDVDRKMMRSPINGSRGPRLEQTAEDWCTHREVLDHYPPPFEDIPGVTGPTCPWSDDDVYQTILERINARMAKGDVPLNLTSTSLVTHAYLYTGDEKYRRHVLEYLGAWKNRTNENEGILPDNIGPSGIIGECMDGKWWGGYYGWRWPHGVSILLEACLIAGSNGLLLTGDEKQLDLYRSQIDLLCRLGKVENGQRMVPHKHKDAGWCDFRPMSPDYLIYCWYLTQDDRDLQRIHRMCDLDIKEATSNVGKGHIGNTAQWFQYIRGENPSYPEEILSRNLEVMATCIDKMRRDHGDPEIWDVDHWQAFNPVVCEGLVQLMMGAPMHIYHGGLLHGTLRYYDAISKRAGLPKSVSALVEFLHRDFVVVQLVNLDPTMERLLVVQSGTFGEHSIKGIEVLDQLDNVIETHAVSSKWIQCRLSPSTRLRVRLKLSRYENDPSYETPFVSRTDYPPLIQGRAVE